MIVACVAAPVWLPGHCGSGPARVALRGPVAVGAARVWPSVAVGTARVWPPVAPWQWVLHACGPPWQWVLHACGPPWQWVLRVCGPPWPRGSVAPLAPWLWVRARNGWSFPLISQPSRPSYTPPLYTFFHPIGSLFQECSREGHGSCAWALPPIYFSGTPL